MLLFLLGLLLLLLMLWLLSCIAFEQSASTLFFPTGPIVLVHSFAQRMASQIIAKTLVYIFVFIGNILYTLSALRFLQLAIYLGELSKSVYRKGFLILSTDAYYSVEWCAVNDLTSSLLGVSSLLQLPPIWR